MSMDKIPPYGLFPDFYRKHTEWRDKVPGDWLHANTPEGDQRFFNWREQRLFDIRDNIWPEWVPGTGWEGDAKAFAAEMSKREVELMTEHFVKTDILGEVPGSSGGAAYTHLDHYEFEDGRLYGKLLEDFRAEDEDPSKPKIGRNFFLYDNTPTDGGERQAFLSAIADSYTGKTNQFYFWFKERLMRPRPYQMALIFNLPEFRSRRAMTAMHSAIVSGHATTGLMIRCGALEEMLDAGPVSKPMLQSFSQFIVDVGDRRVFAGVHYPTDNLSSWILALTLIPSLFRHAETITNTVKRAIKDHSAVYDLINKEYRKEDVFKKPVDLLDNYL